VSFPQASACYRLALRLAVTPYAEPTGLSGVEEVKIEAVTVGEHHNMRGPPDMWH